MLNEDKVRYMTDLAIFEKNKGRKIFPINRYFKRDFVGGHVLRSFFGFTFCYLLFLAMWLLYKLDELMDGVSVDEILEWGRKWGLTYMIGLVVYLLITGVVYSKRYEYASRSQSMYASKLKHLLNRYGREKTGRTKENRGGKIR